MSSGDSVATNRARILRLNDSVKRGQWTPRTERSVRLSANEALARNPSGPEAPLVVFTVGTLARSCARGRSG
jgi:hypothetical protein